MELRIRGSEVSRAPGINESKSNAEGVYFRRLRFYRKKKNRRNSYAIVWLLENGADCKLSTYCVLISALFEHSHNNFAFTCNRVLT